jgi:hypothetical protein
VTPDWLTALIACGTVGTAVVGLWRFVVRPLLRGAMIIDSISPVLRQIAADFRPNGRPGLKEQIDGIRDDVNDLRQQVREMRGDDLADMRRDVKASGDDVANMRRDVKAMRDES